MSEISFEVGEDELAGGYIASAWGIHTPGETLDELRAMVKDAPKIVRLHFVRDEVLAV